MNIRLIMGILGGIIAAEFVAILVQLNIYKKEIDKGIEYENFRKQVLLKAAKERRELREALAKQQELKNKMEELLKSRREKQPNMPSAGSIFKRGEDYISAKLIDECGLKGYTIGGAQVSEKHAGFIVNTGEATAQDILDLIAYVKEVVFEKTGKSIKLEVEVLGE